MVYIFLADGFEEIEALTCADVLRRAHIDVKTVGVNNKEVTGAHGITVKADISLSEILLSNELCAVILPGGMPGAENLYNSPEVLNAVRFAHESGKCVAAICAAPYILGELGILKGKKAVCYPGFEAHLKGALIQKTPVARDGNLITGNGPGAALQFAAELCRYLEGSNKTDEVLGGMLCKL